MNDNHAGGPSAVLAIRNPADLLAAVPYLVGFHTDESIVVVGLARPRMNAVFTMRSDLPPSNDPAEIAGRASYLAHVLALQHPAYAMIAGFGPGARVTPIAEAVRTEIEALDIPVRESLRAHDGRYWSYLCASVACCPPEGTVYDPTASVFAAHATVAGCVALPDRAALVAEVAPVGGAERAAMRAATERAERRFAALVGRALSGTPPEAGERPPAEVGAAAVGAALDRHAAGAVLGDDEVAWLALLLTHLRVRDEAWVRIDERDDHAHRGAQRGLWTHVLRRVEPDYVPAPACLLAYTAWRDGDGGLANVALDRARRADPGYTMACLIDQLLSSGSPPGAWRPLNRGDLGLDDARAARHRARHQRRRAAQPPRLAAGGRPGR
ncbi:MAG TPA: DUF4192 domain-containing protein [Streptosporangiaceae bacterium]|jgi:hypothetical protein